MNRTIILLSGVLSAALPLLVDSALKGAALLTLAGLLALALRRASAAARHLVWLIALAALLMLPMMSAMLPGWRVLPAWTSIAPSDSSPPSIAVDSSPAELQPPLYDRLNASSPDFVGTVGPQAPSVPNEAALTFVDWAPAIWAAGFAALLLRLCLARWALSRTSRRGKIVSEGRLFEMMDSVRKELRVGQDVRLLLDSEHSIPVVWGLFRPTVMLPGEAVDWSEHQVRSVLLHELAHIKRRDLAAQIVIQFACALHWFNPLVWFAAWRLHVEAEHACDNLVLTNGVRASDYAEHVLSVATRLTPACSNVAGLAMARPSRLEGRMIAVLSNKCDRRGVTRTLLLAALFLGVFVLVPVAMLRAGDEKKTDAQKPPAADSPSSNPKPAGNVDIPQSDAAANETVTVDVAEDGSLSLNGKSVSLKSLSNEVASLGGNPNPHIDVHVAAGAPFNRVVEVFDELEKVGGGITIRTPGKTGVSRVPGIRRDRDAEPADVVRQKRLRSEAQRDKAKRESDVVRIEDERARVDAVQADVARLKLRQAEAQLRRMERLSADNLISNSELDAAKLEVGRWKAASLLDSKEKWKAEVELAEAEVALNEANLKRMAELFDQKLVAESEMEMAKAESAIAKAKLRGAMARLRTADSAKAVDADTRPGPAANPAKKERLLQILDDEIKVASDQAKLVRDQRRQGLASTEALFRAELDVMALQRERASLEGEPAKVKELIGQQIGVLQELERVTREQRQQGAENESEVLKVRRQILMLQRQQAQMDF